MPKRKRRKAERLEAYRRLRKRVPPPERTIPDRRRKIEERTADEEIEDERKER